MMRQLNEFVFEFLRCLLLCSAPELFPGLGSAARSGVGFLPSVVRLCSVLFLMSP